MHPNSKSNWNKTSGRTELKWKKVGVADGTVEDKVMTRRQENDNRDLRGSSKKPTGGKKNRKRDLENVDLGGQDKARIDVLSEMAIAVLSEKVDIGNDSVVALSEKIETGFQSVTSMSKKIDRGYDSIVELSKKVELGNQDVASLALHLDMLSENIGALYQRVISDAKDIASFSQKLDLISENIDSIHQLVNENSQDIISLSEKFDKLSDNMEVITGVVGNNQGNNDEDICRDKLKQIYGDFFCESVEINCINDLVCNLNYIEDCLSDQDILQNILSYEDGISKDDLYTPDGLDDLFGVSQLHIDMRGSIERHNSIYTVKVGIIKRKYSKSNKKKSKRQITIVLYCISLLLRNYCDIDEEDIILIGLCYFGGLSFRSSKEIENNMFIKYYN